MHNPVTRKPVDSIYARSQVSDGGMGAAYLFIQLIHEVEFKYSMALELLLTHST